MKRFGQQVSQARKALGLTQRELSALAGVSLATLQNIEAGRANPAVTTLEKVLRAIGMELDMRPLPVDWGVLCSLGIPYGRGTGTTVRPTPDMLVQQMGLALAELSRDTVDRADLRKVEAVQATLNALREHFPTFFKQRFSRIPLAVAFLPEQVTGRLIRLSRMAVGRLAKYL